MRNASRWCRAGADPAHLGLRDPRFQAERGDQHLTRPLIGQQVPPSPLETLPRSAPHGKSPPVTWESGRYAGTANPDQSGAMSSFGSPRDGFPTKLVRLVDIARRAFGAGHRPASGRPGWRRVWWAVTVPRAPCSQFGTVSRGAQTSARTISAIRLALSGTSSTESKGSPTTCGASSEWSPVRRMLTEWRTRNGYSRVSP